MNENWKNVVDKKIAMAFSIVLTFWTMNSFSVAHWLLTLVVVAVVHSILFAILSYLSRRGPVGAVFFCFGSVLYLIGIQVVIEAAQASADMQYQFWIASAGSSREVAVVPGFWFATILSTSYIFSSIVYYFTSIRYRVAMLFFVGILPFIIASAKAEGRISIPFIIYVAIFFVLYIERTRRKSGGRKYRDYVSTRPYIGSVALFIVITLMIAWALPKPDILAENASLDTAIGRAMQPLGMTNLDGSNKNDVYNPMQLKLTNYIGSMTAPERETVLFEVEAEEPLYLRVQSWDQYEKNCWVIGNESLWEEVQPIGRFTQEQEVLGILTSLLGESKRTEGMPLEFTKISEAYRFPSIPPKSKKVTIIKHNQPASFLVHPPGITGIEGSTYLEDIYINELATCFLKNRDIWRENDRYTVSYISQHLVPDSREDYIAKHLNKNVAETLLYAGILADMGKNGVEGTSKQRDIINVSMDQMNIAYENYTSLSIDLPERIYTLADSITREQKSDYEKAMAIQSFFHKGDFKYDLKPLKAAESQDYHDFFMFESKKGICVHFASSMVLLARASGLPARYVEGFVAKEKDTKTGRYIVRQKHAHAFPEIYIAGYGWRVFEPTVSNEDPENQSFAFFSHLRADVKGVVTKVMNGFVKVPFGAVITFIALSILSCFLLALAYIQIRHHRWKNSLLKVDRKKAVEQIFQRTVLLLKHVGLGIKKDETPSSYAVRVSKECGIALGQLAQVFNESKYGGKVPSDVEMASAIESYNTILGFVKNRIGKVRGWMIR